MRVAGQKQYSMSSEKTAGTVIVVGSLVSRRIAFFSHARRVTPSRIIPVRNPDVCASYEMGAGFC